MNAAIALARNSSRTSASRTAQALARFAKPYRSAISRLAARHPRLADLAISFPALLFGLAMPRRGFDPEPAIARVIAGAPLAELSALTGIPLWTRKLLPRVLTAPLPRLPDSAAFARQIVNHLPQRNREEASWLDVIADTARWGHEDLAVWFARHYAARENIDAIRQRWALAAWAWHCRNPSAPASAALAARWTPAMSCTAALDAVWRWVPAVSFLLLLDGREITDHWATPASVDGFTFAPVSTPQELAAISGKLDNCAHSSGDDIALNYRRFWRVDRGGDLVAMLSISNDSVLHLSEISGYNNRRVSPELAMAAQRWFIQFCPPAIIHGQDTTYTPGAWQRMWTPYWLAKRGFHAGLTLSPIPNRWDWFDPDVTGSRRRNRLRRRRMRI